jgi:L-threonylcarbamoyladenylate synthase
MRRTTSLSEFLQQPGAIAVIPTDTVYGVVGRAADPVAVQAVYAAKHREHKPGTLIAASIEQLVALGFKRRSLTAVEQFWPGAVSVIVPCPDLEYLHQGVGSLAVRIPSDPWLQALLEETGPLQTSSANLPGEPPATTINEARAYFGDTIQWYEDGGVVNRPPSTIVQVVGTTVKVIRQGAVDIE